MTVSQETIEELVSYFRSFSPENLSDQNFVSSDLFFRDFENFKMPLIAYLSDKVEHAMRTVPDEINEDFLRGYLDGAVCLIRLIADLQLIKNHGVNDAHN